MNKAILNLDPSRSMWRSFSKPWSLALPILIRLKVVSKVSSRAKSDGPYSMKAAKLRTSC